MIAIAVEIITEYIGVMLCIHKVAGKKIKISWQSLFDFACCAILLYIGEKNNFSKIFLYAYLLIYTRIRVANTWKLAIKSYVVTMCAVPILQLFLYGVVSDIIQDASSVYLAVAIIINILIIIFFIVWKEKYLSALADIIIRYKKTVFLVLLLFLLKSLITYYLEFKFIEPHYMGEIVVFFLIVALISILWINSENEKRHKAEELRTYQLYTETFEDAVAAIRMKQHEFDNHINAIKCMQYTVHDPEKLIEEQNKYCDKILQDNKYNKLLKLKTSPILIGYLYSKFTAASTHGINVEYEIQDINIEKISINDLIEIIGILFDNAVEALECQENKDIEVKMLQDDNRFIVSVANRSDRKTNSEIEKFFEYGYSTKGDGHGVGLHRANMLVKKYKACIQVENILKYGENYLCFKIAFDLKIKGIA